MERRIEELMERWMQLPDDKKASESKLTSSIVRRLLARGARFEFPFVPVMLDGQRINFGIIDDAFLYLRVEWMSRARAGALEGFDPLAFLANAMTNVIAQIWKADPMRASRWTVSEARWKHNIQTDEEKDVRVLGISAKDATAPLLLESEFGLGASFRHQLITQWKVDDDG